MKEQQHDQYQIFGSPSSKVRRKSQFQIVESKTKCQQCGYQGEFQVVSQHGWASVSWIVCLALFTGVLFWIPLVKDSFKDKVTRCPGCQKQFEIEEAQCL